MTDLNTVDAAVLLTDIARLTPLHTEVKDGYRQLNGYVPEWVDNYIHVMSTIRYRAIKAPISLSIEDCDTIAAVEAGLRRDIGILNIMRKAHDATRDEQHDR